MEFIVANFPNVRTLRSGGVAVGPTGQMLAINGGLHTFTLSGPPDYAPAAQRILVANTSVANPLAIDFLPVDAWLTAHVPNLLRSIDQAPPTVDGALAHLAPLGLAWTVERFGVGRARASALLQAVPPNGETWTVMILENAAAAEHRHLGGGTYGETLTTLAGSLNDVSDAGDAITVDVGQVITHAANTVHAPVAPVYWAGVFHQPRGATPVV